MFELDFKERTGFYKLQIWKIFQGENGKQKAWIKIYSICRKIHSIDSMHRHEKNIACWQGNGNWVAITLSGNQEKGGMINSSINGDGKKTLKVLKGYTKSFWHYPMSSGRIWGRGI